MKYRIATTLLILSSALFGQIGAEHQFGLRHGSGPVSQSSINLNTTNTWLAFGFRPNVSKTLTRFRVYAASITGTMAASDLAAVLYNSTANNTYQPNAALQSSSGVTSGAPSGSGWIEFGGFSTMLTAGRQYWVVVKNVNGSPAANYPAFRYVSGAGLDLTGVTTSPHWGLYQTTNSGGSWSNVAGSANSHYVGFSDGTGDGLPLQATYGFDVVYGTIERGVAFATPADGQLILRGVSILLGRSGSPAGDVRIRLYQDSTLVATSIPILSGECCGGSGTAPVLSYFAVPVVLDPGKTYRLMLSDTAPDNASNGWGAHEVVVDSSAFGRSLGPMGGTWRATKTTNNTATPVVFTDVDNQWPAINLLVSSGELVAPCPSCPACPSNRTCSYAVIH